MAKPFKIVTPVSPVGRGSDGKFVKLPLPAQVIEKGSADSGATNAEANRQARVPDRNVGSGAPKNEAGESAGAKAPVYPDSNPWPEAGPINDANKVPFKGMK